MRGLHSKGFSVYIDANRIMTHNIRDLKQGRRQRLQERCCHKILWNLRSTTENVTSKYNMALSIISLSRLFSLLHVLQCGRSGPKNELVRAVSELK